MYMCVAFLKPSTAFFVPGPRIPLKTHDTDGHAAIMQICTGVQQMYVPSLSNILHPCVPYRQLKFCVQSLLNGLCKQANYQLMF
jgi:hypothetical protein